MRFPTHILSACLAMAWIPAPAPAAPAGLTVVGHDGTMLLQDAGDEAAPAPIVLLNGEIADPGDTDCDRAPEHPQCLTLAWLAGSSAPKSPPGVIFVVLGEGVSLAANYPSTYPPPVVLVGGAVVNWPAHQNSVQVIGPNGKLLVFQGGQGAAEMPIVLQGDEVLHPGGADCDLAFSQPQCQALDYLLQSEGEGLQMAPGAVFVDPGLGAMLLDVNVGDYPPPVVIVDGRVINRNY